METQIIIKVCESALFGDADTDGINVPASIEKYVEIVTEEIAKEYQGAQIEVVYGDYVSGDEVRYDGVKDDDASDDLRVSTGALWATWQWLVYQPTAKQQAVFEQFKSVETWADVVAMEYNAETKDAHIVCGSDHRLKTVIVKSDGQYIVSYNKVIKP